MKLFLRLFTLILAETAITKPKDSLLQITENLPPENEKQIIPKLFHTIWFDFGKGNDVFPKYDKNMNQLLKLHPDWEFKLWREHEVIALIKENVPEFLETFTNYEEPIKKHDSARIIILYLFGGVYLDQDFIPVRKINPLMKSYEFIIGNEDPSVFMPINAFIGSVKNHPLLKMLIQEMNNPEIAKKFVLEATGPALLKKVMQKYVKIFGPKGIKVYSHKFFYPIAWYDKSTLQKLKKTTLKRAFPFCYLLQEYDANWK